MEKRLRSLSLDKDSDLFDITFTNINDDQICAWVKGKDGLTGFGIHKSHTVRGLSRFEEARSWWQAEVEALDVANGDHNSERGPVLFTSFSFDSEEDSTLIIPRIIAGRFKEKSWITYVGNGSQPQPFYSQNQIKPLHISWGGSNREAWREQVALAIRKIKDKKLDKVVLARFLTGKSKERIDVRRLLRLLANEYPSTWVYSNSGLVGATPELLVRLSNSVITSRILAGTISKTGDDEKDLVLAKSLARSSKDLEEHEYAVQSVVDALSPLCRSVTISKTPFILHLPNVMHLATDVTAILSDSANPADIFDLASILHPSAAVCGTPRDLAKKAIDEIEGILRGRYAGPVGWIDSKGDGELALALRCGQIASDGKSIRIFAGCGIVAGSDPEREFAESQAKLLPMRSALEKH